MPDPYRHRRHALKDQIVARVAAGTSLERVCAEPGMPADVTVMKWRRADPAFGQAMDDALRRGLWRRRHAFDPVRAEALLARYRAGEPMARILADPAMPSRTVFRRWLADQAPFAEEIHRLKQRNRAWGATLLARARLRRPFDRAVADRLLYRVGQGQHLKSLHLSDPTLPTPRVVARWRREQPTFDYELAVNLRRGRGRQRHVARRRCAAVAPRILGRVAAGASLAEAVQAPGLPSLKTLHRWLRADPDFARRMRLACAHRDALLIDQLQTLAERAVPGTVTEAKALMAPISARLGRMRRRGD